jgi:hypothetical protein
MIQLYSCSRGYSRSLRKFVCQQVGDPFWISSSSLNAQTAVEVPKRWCLPQGGWMSELEAW